MDYRFDKMKNLRRLAIVLIVLYIFIFLIYYFLFFSKYVELAMGSVKANCELIPSLSSSNQLTDKNLKDAGVNGYFSPSTNKITILVDKNDEDYIKILRHELCHYEQKLNGIDYNCNQKIGLFFQELTCYVKN